MCAQDRASIGELSKYKKYRHEKSIAPEEKACVYSSNFFLNLLIYVCSLCGFEVLRGMLMYYAHCCIFCSRKDIKQVRNWVMLETFMHLVIWQNSF